MFQMQVPSSTRCGRSVAVHANSICALDWLSASVFGSVKPPASLFLRFFPVSLRGWLLDVLCVNSFVASFSARCVRSCGPKRCRMKRRRGSGSQSLRADGDPDNRDLRSGIQSEVELLVARGRASTECQNTRTRNGGGNNVAPSVC